MTFSRRAEMRFSGVLKMTRQNQQNNTNHRTDNIKDRIASQNEDLNKYHITGA
jgi:hypothetical protein